MHSSIVSGPESTFDPEPSQAPLIIFAGGGSGGHLFPALAIAERLTEVAPDVRTLFLCSQRRIDRSILTAAGVDFIPLPAQPVGWRPFPKALIRFASGWSKSVRRTTCELHQRSARTRPTVIALMGGFVAAPVARAARKCAVPAMLVNLDVTPGKANRLIARFATRIISAVQCPGFPKFSQTVVGMPIRKAAIASDPPDVCRRRMGLKPDTRTLLVVGASQGAGTFNRLLTDLVAARPDAFQGWQVLHLTGELDLEAVQAAYRNAAVEARVLRFCTDMAAAWGSADLALSRCGASSVAEALANRVPTLFSPYPWHRDQHQRLNAIESVRAGQAWMVDDAIDPKENLDTMGIFLLELMGDSAARDAVRTRLALSPRPDAALAIARLLRDEAARRPPDQPGHFGPMAEKSATKVGPPAKICLDKAVCFV